MIYPGNQNKSYSKEQRNNQQMIKQIRTQLGQLNQGINDYTDPLLSRDHSVSPSHNVLQLTLKDFPEALKLSSRQFVAREPMSNLIWTELEFQEALGPLIYQCCKSGLSFGLRNQQTNELIAAQLSVGLQNYQIEPNNRKSEPIFAILNKCEQGYVPDNPSKALALFIVVSSSKESRKGNLKKILGHSEQIWKARGYEQVFSDATNISSASLLKKNGYEVRNIALYQQFEYKNEKPFVSLAKNHMGVTFVVKKLK